MLLVQPLTGSHDRLRFDCQRSELNAWLRQVARQHQDKGLSKTFVLVDGSEPAKICGFYALTLAELDRSQLPEIWHKKLPRRIPGVRLGRLAVDGVDQGKGFAELLLVDAIGRSRRIHQEAGGLGLFVDAMDERAAGFYRRYGFQSCPDQALLLFLPTHHVN
ncbi:GNAT family N-acetyltransferase [Rhodoferax sp.]|uniref:GNAT family N-acetyltransferase n=1 Tax=Rhodoferax sp. TaxID=50421 RepID=UPI00262EDDF1|nr:GNAT family N-acetyltransferase [Rhodoferax sp.]MDD2808532.1 GNAT family N-acetyltransferase [Rhodoferax sp.]